MKNITLSMDDDVLHAARQYAHLHHISLNVLVRKLIEQTVVPKQSRWLDDVFTLMDKVDANSEDQTWSRDDLYRV
jgi:hypothetical protein